MFQWPHNNNDYNHSVLPVDASEAGKGTLDLSVGPPGKTVPHNVRDIGKQLFLIEFVPEDPVDHEVTVQFNDVHIPGKGDNYQNNQTILLSLVFHNLSNALRLLKARHKSLVTCLSFSCCLFI